MFVNYSYNYLMSNGKFLGYLQARFDSRQSFYKKARIFACDGQLVLISYDTIVSKIEILNGKARAQIFGYYSETTKRHIYEFLKQAGFDISGLTAKGLKNISDKNNGMQLSRISSEYQTSKNILNYVDLI